MSIEKFFLGQRWKNHNKVVLKVEQLVRGNRPAIYALCSIVEHPLPIMVGARGTFSVEELKEEGYKPYTYLDRFHGK